MRIGVISYSTVVRTDILLGEINNVTLLPNEIWEIEYMAGVTNTAEAFTAMRDMFMR